MNMREKAFRRGEKNARLNVSVNETCCTMHFECLSRTKKCSMRNCPLTAAQKMCMGSFIESLSQVAQ